MNRQLKIGFLLAYGLLIVAAIASQVANAQTWVAPKYDCTPKAEGELHAKKFGSFAVAFWDCDLPTKIKFNYYFGDPANIPNLEVVPSLAKIFAFLQGNMKRGPTPEEMVIIDAYHEAVGVKMFVTQLTGSTDRPIYAATATNTKGKDTGLRAPVGARCGYKRLQDSAGKPTNYFDYPGGYVQCTITGVVTKP